MRTTVAALLTKELTLEWRTRESVPAMVLFSIATYVVFHFGLDRDRIAGDLASGVLWVTLLFAAILGVNRLFVAEYEQGGFDGFLLAPVDRSAPEWTTATRSTLGPSRPGSSLVIAAPTTTSYGASPQTWIRVGAFAGSAWDTPENLVGDLVRRAAVG